MVDYKNVDFIKKSHKHYFISINYNYYNNIVYGHNNVLRVSYILGTYINKPSSYWSNITEQHHSQNYRTDSYGILRECG